MGKAVEMGHHLHAGYSLRTRFTEAIQLRWKPVLAMPSGKRIRQFIAANRWFLNALLSAVIASGASAQILSFPGAKLETESPDGRSMIRNSDSLSESPAHTLTLVEAKSGSSIKIYQYARSVDVLWSPASDAFVINDYEGSDSTRPFLYEVPWTGTKTDILKEFTRFMRRRHEEKLVLKNDHVYFTVRRWINPRELLCQFEAYGEASPRGSGLKGFYVYRIGEGFRVYSKAQVS